MATEQTPEHAASERQQSNVTDSNEESVLNAPMGTASLSFFGMGLFPSESSGSAQGEANKDEEQNDAAAAATESEDKTNDGGSKTAEKDTSTKEGAESARISSEASSGAYRPSRP
ncbi:hypothetical protein JCM10908_004113 [Rhodotorula pacifica]|uniref:uncharacterized protein n=1 Tax=Rhodotorula pacifica TaxID=1495444 RepID=UPI00317D4847